MHTEYYYKMLKHETSFTIPISRVPQVMQAQLDAATQTTRDLRERTAEKDIALDLTASHLQQEDVARRALQDTIKSALGLLHHAAFQVNTGLAIPRAPNL